MSDIDIDQFLVQFEKWSPDKQIELISFLKAKEGFYRALREDSFSVYSEAFQLAEQALKYHPRAPEIHYIAGMAHFRAWRDRDYALKKYKD